jgi:hypothetical protein
MTKLSRNDYEERAKKLNSTDATLASARYLEYLVGCDGMKSCSYEVSNLWDEAEFHKNPKTKSKAIQTYGFYLECKSLLENSGLWNPRLGLSSAMEKKLNAELLKKIN